MNHKNSTHMKPLLQPYPKVGDSVRGKHIFGNLYTGKITLARPHSMEPERTVCFIDFDKPTDLGISPSMKTGDVRTEICTEVYPPQFKGDLKWEDGNGAWFEIVP
jgi:hypothetical protein